MERAQSECARLASSTSHTQTPRERSQRNIYVCIYLPLGKSWGAAWDRTLLSPAHIRTQCKNTTWALRILNHTACACPVGGFMWSTSTLQELVWVDRKWSWVDARWHLDYGFNLLVSVFFFFWRGVKISARERMQKQMVTGHTDLLQLSAQANSFHRLMLMLQTVGNPEVLFNSPIWFQSVTYFLEVEHNLFLINFIFH